MSGIGLKVRAEFQKGDDIRDAGLTTPDFVERTDDILYGEDPKWQVLDLYRPKNRTGEKLPVIVSIHGGGWVYGDKERYQYYCMSLVEHGFAVVNFTYRLAPEFQFPAALEDTNLVAAWIMEHAEQYQLDTEHIFGVGDSAGAHMLGLYASICTNAEYAAQYEFRVPDGFAWKAVALNCGAYQITVSGEEQDLTGMLMSELLPEKGSAEELEKINVIAHVTESFPTAFVMTSNGDFLKNDAPLLIQKLIECQVPHVFHFYGDKDTTLYHVFHLNMKTKIAAECNKEECDFFGKFL